MCCCCTDDGVTPAAVPMASMCLTPTARDATLLLLMGAIEVKPLAPGSEPLATTRKRNEAIFMVMIRARTGLWGDACIACDLHHSK